MPLEHAKPLRPFQAEKQQQETLNELQRHSWEHTPALRGASCSQPSHQITTDTVTCPSKTTAPNPALSFPGTPLPHPLYLSPMGSLMLERGQRLMQPGEAKSLCEQCIPSWQWRGSRKHFPKELLSPLPHTDGPTQIFSSFKF